MLITLIVAGFMIVKGYSILYTVGVCLILQAYFCILNNILQESD